MFKENVPDIVKKCTPAYFDFPEEGCLNVMMKIKISKFEKMREKCYIQMLVDSWSSYEETIRLFIILRILKEKNIIIEQDEKYMYVPLLFEFEYGYGVSIKSNFDIKLIGTKGDRTSNYIKDTRHYGSDDEYSDDDDEWFYNCPEYISFTIITDKLDLSIVKIIVDRQEIDFEILEIRETLSYDEYTKMMYLIKPIFELNKKMLNKVIIITSDSDATAFIDFYDWKERYKN